MFTKKLCDITKNDRFSAGGKGAFLGELVLQGIPVPPGCVILAAAFDEFLDGSGLRQRCDLALQNVVKLDITAIDAVADNLQELITSADLPAPLAAEIERQFEELEAEFVAVRSSATAEDSASNAWAGQLETYLNTDKSLLLQNVKKCWASLYSPRAICYRMDCQQLPEKISVAVVMQKMVESAISGVAFSVHPVTENSNHIVIEAGIGLGEAIVSGAITPDNYVIAKDTLKIIEKFISKQDKAIHRLSNGETGWQAVPKNQQKRQKLTDPQIIELARLVMKIEQRFGFPCDVEWALLDKAFFILQCRPITTLGIGENDAAKENHP
jgi:phosphoenolpyruvate synthase/pyruvate phosphate dikinase